MEWAVQQRSSWFISTHAVWGTAAPAAPVLSTLAQWTERHLPWETVLQSMSQRIWGSGGLSAPHSCTLYLRVSPPAYLLSQAPSHRPPWPASQSAEIQTPGWTRKPKPSTDTTRPNSALEINGPLRMSRYSSKTNKTNNTTLQGGDKLSKGKETGET